MIKFTLKEVIEKFKDYNRKNGVVYDRVNNSAPEITAIIVYSQDNFKVPFTETERSYRVGNESGRVFFDMPSGSKSMVGSCLDGKDLNVRLDCLGWKVDYCYFEQGEEND